MMRSAKRDAKPKRENAKELAAVEKALEHTTRQTQLAEQYDDEAEYSRSNSVLRYTRICNTDH